MVGCIMFYFSMVQVHFFFIEFHIIFSYLIKYFHIVIIIIVFWFGTDRPSAVLFLNAHFTFFHSHASLLTFILPSSSVSFVLFHSCCYDARVFWKTLVHQFHISYSHTEGHNFLFRQCNYKCIMCVRSEKGEILNTSKPVPLN